MKMKENKGVTIIALIVTIVVLSIIAGIAINSGAETIERAKLEELRTNMLLIQAKAREYVEEVDFKMGPTPDESKRVAVRQEVYGKAGLLSTGNGGISSIPSDCYVVTDELLETWGLGKIKLNKEENERYLIEFDETNLTVEVYNTIGFTVDDEVKYSLSELDLVEL